MNKYNPTEEKARRAEQIRKQYMEKGTEKIDQLEALHTKVKTPGLVTASILGVIGSLVMGAGMSYIMVWDQMTPGLILGIPGLIMILLAWPVYQLITEKRKKKYADQILKLSGEIMDKEED